MDLLAFLSSIAWPLIVGGTIYYLRNPLAKLIEGIKALKVKVGDHEVELTRQEATRALQEMLEDVKSLVGDLNEDEKSLYIAIRSSDGKKQVDDYFPGFDRNSKEHQMLQSLRERKLIRPFEGSSWQPEKHPVTTRFSNFVEQVAPTMLASTPNKSVNKDASR